MKSRAKLKLVSSHPAGPSRSFIELTRNIELAEQAPRKFVATVKQPGDIVL